MGDERRQGAVLGPAQAEQGGIEALAAAAHAKTTDKTYKSAERRYVHFCAKNSFVPYPAAPNTLEAFLVDDVSKASSFSTINTAVAAIKTAHAMANLPDPFANQPRLQLAIKGAAKKLSRPPKQARPLTTDVVNKLLALLKTDSSMSLW